jgi:hypothetical protein
MKDELSGRRDSQTSFAEGAKRPTIDPGFPVADLPA